MNIKTAEQAYKESLFSEAAVIENARHAMLSKVEEEILNHKFRAELPVTSRTCLMKDKILQPFKDKGYIVGSNLLYKKIGGSLAMEEGKAHTLWVSWDKNK